MAGEVTARRMGAAVAGAVLVVVLVAVVVGSVRAGAGDEVSLLGSTGILARAESEERSAHALAHGQTSEKETAAPASAAAATPKETRAQELQQEMKDMQEMKNIRTYSGGGGKILKEAKQMEKTLKHLADLSQKGKQTRQRLESVTSKAALKEGAPKATEHALAREEELMDCEPFCNTHALAKSRKVAHEQLKKDEARQRMVQVCCAPKKHTYAYPFACALNVHRQTNALLLAEYAAVYIFNT